VRYGVAARQGRRPAGTIRRRRCCSDAAAAGTSAAPSQPQQANLDRDLAGRL